MNAINIKLSMFRHVPRSFNSTSVSIVWLLLTFFMAGCGNGGIQSRVTVPNADFKCSFNKPPYINPSIIEVMSGFNEQQIYPVAAITLWDNSWERNMFLGGSNIKVDMLGNETNAAGEVYPQAPFVYEETTHGEGEFTNSYLFGYQYIGMTHSGIYVLRTNSHGDYGSSTFESLMFVSFEYDNRVHYDPNEAKVKGKVRLDRGQLLIEKLGEFVLGDRYEGLVRVSGDKIFIAKDEGMFAADVFDCVTNDTVLTLKSDTRH